MTADNPTAQSTPVDGGRDHTDSDSIEVVELTGRLDVVSSNDLRETLGRHIAAGRTKLVVDLSRVDFVDSSGLAALVRAMKRARQNGGDVRVVRPRRKDAIRVFELTTFDKIFTMGDSVEALSQGWSNT